MWWHLNLKSAALAVLVPLLRHSVLFHSQPCRVGAAPPGDGAAVLSICGNHTVMAAIAVMLHACLSASDERLATPHPPLQQPLVHKSCM
jgi:hypothetical protein